MIDRTSKVIFAAIALGLWMNVFAPFLHPARASAEELFDVVSALGTIDSDLRKIGGDVSDLESYLHRIEGGICLNKKIC